MKVSQSYSKAVNKQHNFKAEFSPKVSRLVVEPVVENGRIVNKSSYKEVDLAEERKSFKAEDFYLENLIAVGAVGNLREVNLSNSGLTAIDGIVSQLENINVDE